MAKGYHRRRRGATALAAAVWRGSPIRASGFGAPDGIELRTRHLAASSKQLQKLVLGEARIA
jgi:hypothetical protein